MKEKEDYLARTRYKKSQTMFLTWIGEKKYPFNIFELMVVFLFEIQIDICAEEMGNNVRPAAMLLGDINAVTKQVM